MPTPTPPLLPHDGPLAGIRGTVVYTRQVVCADCGATLDVAAILTDAGRVAVITEHEGDIEPRH